ncbi:hypothetical protein BDA96_06G175800 [Sorghum bicolor]|uniref:Serpin domain-containing protein n=1 Tax=Sorghum bicolor TaxID=4558 RepID=A0A921UDP0_SORBI|nr:hypothetical protein BDA96_06G175800 [Sorghum bicolor]
MKAVTEQSNFIFSPMSLRAGLALLAVGTHGATLRSENTHHLDAATARLLSNVQRELVAAAPSPPASLSTARSSSFLKPEFVSSAASAHQAVARSVDFKNQPAAATAEMNAFVEQATAGRIRNLLSDGAVHGDTKVVLANGMHFKATWARRFDPSDTVPHYFYRRDGEPVWVPFLSDAGMHYAESFDAPGLEFKVLRCFYKMVGRDGRLDSRAPCFCMLIFLPHSDDGLLDLLRLAVTEPDFVMRCAPRREQEVCPCKVPKFKFSFVFDAGNALRQLGLSEPFTYAADLSGMVSSMPAEGLYVSAMRQTCAVEVDEEARQRLRRRAPFLAQPVPAGHPRRSPQPMSFVADHPFMFAIVEYEKAELLFLSHVIDPSNED